MRLWDDQCEEVKEQDMYNVHLVTEMEKFFGQVFLEKTIHVENVTEQVELNVYAVVVQEKLSIT